MTELFTNIPESVKQNAEFMFNMAIKQPYAANAAKMLNEYTNSCFNEEEKEFVQFYFNLRLEQLQNETGSTNQR